MGKYLDKLVVNNTKRFPKYSHFVRKNATPLPPKVGRFALPLVHVQTKIRLQSVMPATLLKDKSPHDWFKSCTQTTRRPCRPKLAVLHAPLCRVFARNLGVISVCVMHRPQMGLERQPKGDPEGQPKKPQKDCPKGPETAPIDTPKPSQNDLEMDLAKFTPKAPWSVHPFGSPPNRLQTLPFPKNRSWTYSSDPRLERRACIQSLNSEPEFRARIQSLDSGPGFTAWIQGLNAEPAFKA